MQTLTLYGRLFKLLFISTLFCLTTNSALSQMRQLYLDSDPDNEILKLSYYSPSHGYVAFKKWIGYTSDSGRTFIQKPVTLGNVNYNGYSVNLTFGFGIAGVKAFDQNNILVYGDYGLVPAILYSTNGGNSFTLIYHSQYDPWQVSSGITDMVFPQNNGIGYAVDADRILKTTDNGLTWAPVRIDPGSFFGYLESVDNNTVLAMSLNYSVNKLLKTDNGGASWQTIVLPSLSSGKLVYATFVSSSTGWVNMHDYNNLYYLYKTINGGSTWTLQNDPVAAPFRCKKMKFIDNNTGYALAGPNTVYKTLNSGLLWEPLARDNNYYIEGYSHNDIQCLTATQLWAGGGRGFLEMSTNGGGTPLPKAYFKIDTTGVNTTSTVNLLNFSNPSYQFEWYVNNVLTGTTYNSSYTHNLSSQEDSVKLIVRSGVLTDTIVHYQYFIVPNLPVITTFYPVTGSIGTFVTIKGSALTDVTAVKFGGTNAASFTVVNDNIITAIVANGSTGAVSVTDIHGTFSLPVFTYHAPTTAAPPVINSFTPAAGNIGTTLTLSGNNFSTTATNNIVYFGATRATVSSSTANQLVCTVPAGASYELISLVNTQTGLSCHSKNPFNVTFADSSNFAGHSFTVDFTSYMTNPSGVKAADMDGDGKPDILYTGQAIGGNDSLSILRNITTAGANSMSFEPKRNFGPSIFWGGFGDFSIGDIDGDGKPDLIIPTNGNTTEILKNTSTPGTLSFVTDTSLQTLPGSQAAIISDLDYDGRNDLAVAGFNYGSVNVVRNTGLPGSFSFGQMQNFTVSGNPKDMAAGDLDADGKTDLVVLNYLYGPPTGSNLSIFRNTSIVGAISFAAGTDIILPGNSSNGRDVFVVDYDNDGKKDVIVMIDFFYMFFRNTSSLGNITFASPISINRNGTTGASFFQGANFSNFSGDAKPEMFFGDWSNRNYYLNRNTSVPGTIAFDSLFIMNYANNTMPNVYTSDAGDFNMDGKMDFVVSSADDKIAVFRNTMGTPIPAVHCTSGSFRLDTDYTGTSTSTYQWQQDDGSGFVNVSNGSVLTGTSTVSLYFTNTPIAWNGYKYRCVVDGNRYSSTYVLQLTLVTDPTLTISTPNTTVCPNVYVTFTATLVNGGINVTYQWQKNGIPVLTGSSPTYGTSSLQNNDQIKCVVSSDDVCFNTHIVNSNIITMTIDGAAPAVSIVSDATTICAGGTVTFTATPVNGGTNPTYQWQVNAVNAGTNSPVFITSSILTNSVVKVTLTNSTTCTTPVSVGSNSIGIIVTAPLPASVSIATTTPNICTGSSVTFTATPVNEGSSPAYQWQVNGVNAGTNSATFTTSSLIDGDQVNVTMTSSAACVAPVVSTSNVITISVSSSIVPAVSISTASTNICIGVPVTFTATPVNGGATPSYQWQVNGVNAGTNSATFTTSSLTNGDQVSVIMTSSATCASPLAATSNIITVSVGSVTPSVSIIADATTVCVGTTVTFTATPVNGGTAPAYQWIVDGVNAGTNSPVFATASLNSNSQVTVTMTSNAACASPASVTSNTITVTVNSLTPALSITTPSTNVCDGAIVMFNAVPVNGGTSPIITWQINGTNMPGSGVSFGTSILANGDVVSATLISNAACLVDPIAFSNVITMNVNPFSTPAVSIFGTTIVTEGTPSNISSDVTFAGSAPTYQWQDSTSTHGWLDIIGQNGNYIDYIAITTGDALRCIITGTSGGCFTTNTATSAPLSFTVNDAVANNGDLNYYPNPVTGKVLTITNLRLSDQWETLDLVSVDGKNKLSTQDIKGKISTTVNVEKLSHGVYIILLRGKTGKPRHLKIVKG